MLTTDIPSEVLNLLQDNKIIFGAVASTVNERYKRLINFSVPISIQPYSFVVSKPREVSRIYLFTAPFTHGVCIENIRRSRGDTCRECQNFIFQTWLCLAGLIVILPPILFLVNKMSPFYEFHGRSRKIGLFRIDNCFW